MDPRRRFEALRSFKQFLDEAFRVPGTNLRFGWDPIIGIVPWAGDVLTAVFACGIIMQAHQMRVPRVVQIRMLMNVAIDLLIGIVPFVGDVADVFWKSNSKNFALLERHAVTSGFTRATPGDWVFVIGLLAAVLALALIPLALLYWVVYAMMNRPPLT
jgi:hypothetical protein